MNLPRLLILPVLALFAAAAAAAQDAAVPERSIESAYLRNDGPALDAAAARLQEALASHPGDGAFLYLRGFAGFARGTRLRFSDDRDGARETLERAARALEPVRGKPWEAEAAGLRGYILTQLIGLGSGAEGVELGPESGRLLRLAAEKLPHSPRVLLFCGLSRWLTPAEYGGDPAEGLRLIRASVAAFDDEAKDTAYAGPRWGRADALGWLGTALKKQGDRAGARRAWEEALAAAPDYWLVKRRLLPSLSR